MRFLLRLIGVIGVISGSFLIAQQQDVVSLSDFPVPAWPQDGKVPPELKDKYVFIDLAKNEYVVAYPENLGTETFATNPGALKINRYELLRNTAPSISLAVTSTPAGKFKYAYTISNGATAKQSIDQLIVVLPEAAAKDAIVHPEGWMAIVQKGRNFKLKDPQWLKNGAAAVWSFHKIEQTIQPGASKTGFELESELRPGFTVAYVRKAESVDVKVATHGNVPKDVKDQLDQLLAIEYNSKTVLTLGPKFDKSADDHTIAGDFIQGIFTLSRAGILELNSEFVRTTLNELTGIQPGAKAALKLTVPARPGAEMQVLNALKVSLRQI